MTLKSKGATAIDPGEKLYIYIYIYIYKRRFP
jgi:hypothetical protein